MSTIPTSPPANPVPGAVYVDIATNRSYVWTGNSWMLTQGSTGYNSQITTGAAILPGYFAQPNPASTLNQIGANEPINPSAGQMWVDQSVTPSPIKIWDGTQWVVIGDGTMTNTTVGTSPPSTPDVGDSFFETSTSRLYIWTGTTWAPLSSGVSGASGTFTSQDGKTVTVANGLITTIV